MIRAVRYAIVVCLSGIGVEASAEAVAPTTEALESAGAEEAAIDPWQGVNRSIYAVNDYADQLLVRPAAQAWRTVLPSLVQRGIHNVLANLDDPGIAVNQLLQGKPVLAASDAGRFVVNSTAGLAGLVDVATRVGLPQHEEDFGQTLGSWGVPSGPFLVLPGLGPSTPSASAGAVVDMLLRPTTWLDSTVSRIGIAAIDFVGTRSRLLDAEDLISGDRYSFIRDAYLQRRTYLQADGVVEDPFLDEETSE